ncbi:hypothetical protein QFC21_003775 [Naganishia friedmannii]|uniref:Uncharacterized protein n=1 Tax=Naganishia friedmannii TaxID=89922 RepID=A0ACC2VLH1_9TREE|nr:hypothetical protein QFC21_003775 [Naganishia friedmannii]
MAVSNPAFAGLDAALQLTLHAMPCQDFVTNTIPYVTMDKLRQVIDVLNMQHRSTVGGAIKKAGKKADLVASVQDAVRAFKRQGNAEGYRKLKASWEAIINPWSARPTPTFAKTAPTPGATLYPPPAVYGSYLGAGNYNYGGAYGTVPGSGPSHASGSTAPSYMNGGRPSAATTFPLVAWKTTPGWKAIKALSDTYLLPAIEDGHASERRNKMATLILSQADIDAVNAAPTEPGQPKKEIRLFCTSSDYYPTAIAAGDSVPLEFPYNSEITVDSKVVQFRKGLKGRANTAAPVPLDSPMHQVTPFADMQRKIINGRRKTKAEVLAGMKASAAEDDIQLGSTKVSLKDPISYTRINNPARADFCSHVQCFDVAQWISVNETTPQYQCPTCEREIQLNQIFTDGYFQTILAMCPDSVDEVIIEPDGEWHTEDQKYASPGWRQAQKSESMAATAGASKANTPLDEKPQFDLDDESTTNGTTSNKAGKSAENGRTGGSARMQEVVALDDSSDDEPIRRIAPRTIYSAPSSESRAREETSSVDRLLDTALYSRSADSAGQSDGTTAAKTTTRASEPVIDLTSTDDEDDEDDDYSRPSLPAWAADIPALARSDKRERSMSSLLEADDRHSMRRRLVEDTRNSSSAYEPSFRSSASPATPSVPAPLTSAVPAVVDPEATSSTATTATRTGNGLKVRLTLPPRPRIDPLPAWMNAAPDRQHGSRDDGASWLNTGPLRTSSTGTGTDSPASTAPSPRPTGPDVSFLPKEFSHTFQRVHVATPSSSVASPAESNSDVGGT